MPTTPSAFTTYQDVCDAWEALFSDPDRGKIYDLFDKEKYELVKHLKKCPVCKIRVGKVNVMALNTGHLHQLSPEEFAKFIRILHMEYQAKLPRP